MTATPNSQVILFADICGSTRLYETLGNTRGQQLVDSCLAAMATVVTANQGQVVKTIGDEVMAAFKDVQTAAKAALAISERIERMPYTVADAPPDLAVRTGFHFGEVLWDKGDVFGDAVNVAARLAGLAKAQQILTSGQSVAHLKTIAGCTLRFLDRTVVKGRSEQVELYELVRQTDEMTRMASGAFAAQPAMTKRLRLSYHGKQRWLALAAPPFTLGRGEQVDLVVTSELASRSHAQIETRGNGFCLIDHSTNGSYILTGGNVQFVRREAVMLQDRGFLLLGTAPAEADEDEQIGYAVEQVQS